MSQVNPGAGYPPVETFLIVHPEKPEAGQVRMDDASFPAWEADGWVKVEEPKKKAAK